MEARIVTATWQAGALSAVSNVLAQLITCWRTNAPLAVNFVDTFQFALFAVLACPPNVVWQSFLEAQFPAYGPKLATPQKGASVDEIVAGRTNDADQKSTGPADARHDAVMSNALSKSTGGTTQKLNKKNTAIKFALDLTLGAVVNNLLFLAGIGLIRGKSSNAIQKDISQQFMPIMFSGLRFWPAVSMLNFTLAPLEYRMLLGNIAGLFWGIFLSLAAA